MEKINIKETLNIDIQIEELEPKIAPDGETVLPLGHGHGGHKH